MSARSARDASKLYVDRLRRAVSCVTRSVLLTTPGHDRSVQIATLSPAPAPLRGPEPFRLVLSQEFRVNVDGTAGVPPIVTQSYRYTLLTTGETEVFAYHWHPVGHSPVTTPHLHVTARRNATDLSKTHFPTGIVSLAEVIRCLIAEFGVAPLRPDWQAVLDEE